MSRQGKGLRGVYWQWQSRQHWFIRRRFLSCQRGVRARFGDFLLRNVPRHWHRKLQDQGGYLFRTDESIARMVALLQQYQRHRRLRILHCFRQFERIDATPKLRQWLQGQRLFPQFCWRQHLGAAPLHRQSSLRLGVVQQGDGRKDRQRLHPPHCRLHHRRQQPQFFVRYRSRRQLSAKAALPQCLYERPKQYVLLLVARQIRTTRLSRRRQQDQHRLQRRHQQLSERRGRHRLQRWTCGRAGLHQFVSQRWQGRGNTHYHHQNRNLHRAHQNRIPNW